MRTVLKYAGALALTGALALAMATPGQARNGRNAALIGGFAAGAVVGAAVANGGYYGGPGYYYGPGPYAYGPAYGYGPGAYAYEPAPARGYFTNEPSCATDGGNGHADYSAC
jgi:hypothetical protein